MYTYGNAGWRKNAEHFSAGRINPCFVRGFTAIEILVSLSIMVLLFSILFTGIVNYVSRQTFESTVVDVRDGIFDARQKTLGSLNNTTYGVHVSSTAIAIFQGATYVEGDANTITFLLPQNIAATSSLAGDVVETNFQRLTGEPSASGTISLFDSRTQQMATITIYASGLVK